MTSAIKILPWDSRTFGCRIAKVNSVRLTPRQAQAAVIASLKQQVRCLYFLASADDAVSMQCADAYRFRLVDIRVTLARDLESLRFPVTEVPPARVSYRSARSTDARPLQRLTQNMFPDSRFAQDPNFPPWAHRKLFSAWIAKSIRGRYDDWVGVAEWRGRLAGFISCRNSGRARGAIGLVGVAPAFRRRGIGRGLLHYGLDWFRARHIRHISVATQGCAIGAQRFYQEAGFRTSQMELWYHKWF